MTPAFLQVIDSNNDLLILRINQIDYVEAREDNKSTIMFLDDSEMEVNTSVFEISKVLLTCVDN